MWEDWRGLDVVVGGKEKVGWGLGKKGSALSDITFWRVSKTSRARSKRLRKTTHLTYLSHGNSTWF